MHLREIGTVEYGGLYGEQQGSFRELAISLILAVVLVFITLLIEFRSFAHPISIVAVNGTRGVMDEWASSDSALGRKCSRERPAT